MANNLVNVFGKVALDETLQAIQNQNDLLLALLRQTRSLANTDTGKRQRVSVDVMPAVTISSGTVTTVSSVTNQAQSAGYDARQFRNQFRIAYNTALSSNS